MKEITKKNMEDFLEIRESGRYNMLDRRVREEIGIDIEQHSYICGHFEELCKKYDLDPD